MNNIRFKVFDVACGKEGSETHFKMVESQAQRKSGEGGLQLFTSKVDVAIGETCLFQIHLEGIVEGYSYNPCDRLAKEKTQMWNLSCKTSDFRRTKLFSLHAIQCFEQTS